MSDAKEAGPKFIRSSDNPALVLSVANTPYPQASGTAVKFASVPSNGDDWNKPASQWVLESVDANSTIFLVKYFPSGGSLVLTASAATANSPLNIVTADATNQLQLWKMDLETHPQFISCVGAPGMNIGFSGDIPVRGMGLQLVKANDAPDQGDKFEISGLGKGD